MAKRIAFANTQEFNPNIGGIESVTNTLVLELIKLGFHVIYICIKRSPYSKNYSLPCSQFFLPNKECLDSEDNVDVFRKVLVDNNIDVLVNQDASSITFSKLCALAKQDTDVRLISCLHIGVDNNINLIKYINHSFLPRSFSFCDIFASFVKRITISYRLSRLKKNDGNLYRFVYENSDKFVLLSDYQIPLFKEIACLPNGSYSNLTVINNPLSLKNVGLTSAVKEKKILFLGRLVKSKRADFILECWRYLNHKYPDWELVFLGDGPERKFLEEYTSDRKINNVRFLGFVDPISYLQSSSILCVGTFAEGFGMNIIEAQAFGVVPIAVNSYLTLPNLITDNINGLIVEKYSINNYVEKLELLITNTELRQEMSINCMKSVVKFDVNVIIKDWIKLFE